VTFKGGEPSIDEQELRLANERLAEAQRLAKIGYWEWQLDADNRVTWSDEVYALFGVVRTGEPLDYQSYFSAVPDREKDRVADLVDKAIKAGHPFYFEHAIARPDGSERVVAIDGRVEHDASGRPIRLLGAAQDVTERHELQEQLRQSQKMEASGRLAGGVAHDFNNLLTVIFSFGEFAVESLEPTHPARADLAEVLRAAEQAKSLTGQLLAFSRQQTVMPRVIDINERVANVDAMLRRILGDDIAFATHLMTGLWNARIDPNALEQVIVNMAVNARDAMPSGGKLTLETSNVILGDEERGGKGRRIPPGEYVALVISDDGEGMSDEVKARIFDPFYTTKGTGRGTGLGLSTSYGIIRQADGYVWVYSEPGQGTTFKVYLPRVLAALDREERRPIAEAFGGTESILLAEDNAQVRDATVRALRALGYTVTVASSGHEALALVDAGEMVVDLLLTDVVMPRMNGKQLADQVATRRPAVKVLFMSGYTENTIVHHGVLDAGIELLQKPFAPAALGARVRQVLDHGATWLGRPAGA
jgi:two-component system, cell cycle sensor histidine kinase and response regulator CckA